MGRIHKKKKKCVNEEAGGGGGGGGPPKEIQHRPLTVFIYKQHFDLQRFT